MNAIQEQLQPLIDLLPEAVRPYWWAVFGLVGILLVLILLGLIGGLFRRVFGRRKAPPEDWAKKLREDLSTYPPPPATAGKQRLTIYHVPVRIRLVVLAPAGKETEIEAGEAEALLNRVIPGLGNIAGHDHPRVRVWPPQMSQQGFATAFFRHTLTPQKEGQPSPWVLVAGRSQFNQPTLLLGLALLAHEPNNLGRVSLEPHQWLDVLRIKEST
jgi:hypothetical protein